MDNEFSANAEENNRIHRFDGAHCTGICYWDGSVWLDGLEFSKARPIGKCDHIYAWADVILPCPKMIYPSKVVEINPSDYHLTEAQLLYFLKDYKHSYDMGYTK